MKATGIALMIIAAALPLAATPAPAVRPRVIVLADMGNEPDEEQQMVHLLLYANELDIEGLVAVTGKFLRQDPQPELFMKLLGAYDQVIANLRLHAEGWPDTAALRSVVAAGQSHYGMADTGPGKGTAGSRLIDLALARPDPRPLNLIVNAGSNTLAQALIELEQRLSPADFAAALARLRVFENGAQDNAGAWICHRWPAVFWIRSNYQTYCYGGPGVDGGKDNKGRSLELGPNVWAPYAYSGTGQHQWALEHLKGNHGPLLALWPIRQFRRGGISFLEGGGTVPFLRLLPNGLNNPEHPSWGGWGGRYSETRTANVWSKHADVRAEEEKVGAFAAFDELRDTWSEPGGTTHADSLFAPVWRWRAAFFNDFAARADWCVQPFAGANHPPLAGFNGDHSGQIVHLTAHPGQKLSFDASASRDPDGNALSVRWWLYPEAGTYPGARRLSLANPTAPVTTLTIPLDSAGTTLHLILEVTDKVAFQPLTAYRRIVITITDT